MNNAVLKNFQKLFVLVSSLFIFSCSNLIDDLRKLTDNGSAYQVQCEFEDLNQSSFIKDPVQIRKGNKDGLTVVPDKFPGFYLYEKYLNGVKVESGDVETGPLAQDGSTLVTFKYKRNEATLTFDILEQAQSSVKWADGTASTQQKTMQSVYGKTITGIDVIVTGGAAVWYLDGVEIIGKPNYVPPVDNGTTIRYTVGFDASKVNYTIQYWFEKKTNGYDDKALDSGYEQNKTEYNDITGLVAVQGGYITPAALSTVPKGFELRDPALCVNIVVV